MTFKDELKAAGRNPGRPKTAPADRAEVDGQDIAELLRALNDDLNPDPAEHIGWREAAAKREADADRGLPLGMIAVALLAALGVGAAVVMLDTPPSDEPRMVAEATVPVQAPGPAQGGASAPAPAIPLAGMTEPPTDRADIVTPPPAASIPAMPLPSLRTPEPPALPEPLLSQPLPAEPQAVTEPPAPPNMMAAETAAPAEPAPMAAEPSNGAEADAMPAQPAAPPPVAPEPARDAPAAKPVIGAAAPEGARYTVQIGSFHVPENAEALVRRLQERGLQAYAVDWNDSARRTWRVVRVGAYRGPEDAQRAADELKDALGLTPIVVGRR